MNKGNLKKTKLNKETSMWKVCTERIAAIIVAILLWQLLAMKLDQKLLLATPVDVAKTLGVLVKSQEFYSAIAYSMGRILIGLLIGAAVGIACALLAGRWHFMEVLFWPYFSAMKATPVASIVILCLVWLSGRRLSVFIVFLVVTPVIYTNILAGIKNLDPKMKDMARVFGINGLRRLLYVYLPELKTYIIAAFALATGMAFKAGIAAEVIGTPGGSVGKMLYNAKVYLETPELFAWTLVIIVLSVVVEQVILGLVKRMFAGLQRHVVGGKICKENSCNGHRNEIKGDGVDAIGAAIDLSNVCFSYNKGVDEELINDLNLHIPAGDRVCIMAPSGTGKTTLLNLITGGLKPDSGIVSFEVDTGDGVNISMVFQEDRLCSEYTAAYNIELGLRRGCRKTDLIQSHLEQLGMGESIFADVKELSGGMKRRVAIVRAVMSPSRVLILDEPFASLDEELKDRTAEYIIENLNGRTLVVVSHDEKDAERLNARILPDLIQP
jgi:NitT/TauT family transport system permease protein